MSRAHTFALLSFLRADPTLKDIVGDGRWKGAAPTRYVLVFPHRPEDENTRMAQARGDQTIRHTIHCVSSIPAAAQSLADYVEGLLVPRNGRVGGVATATPGVRLTVDGRPQGRIVRESGDPMRVDTSANPLVYYFADDYAWEETP